METRVRCAVLALVFVLLCLSGCSGADRKQTDEFYGMGTLVTVTLYGEGRAAEDGFARVRALVAELEGLWSLNVETSDIARLNRSDGGIPDADERTVALLEKAQALCAATDGNFDVTLASLSALWQNCGDENRLPTDGEIADRLARVGTGRLELSGTAVGKPEGVTVDLGAIAKGEAVSLLIRLLDGTEGLTGGLVSMGSSIAVFGGKPDGKPFRVSVRDPKDGTKTVGTLTLLPGEVLSVSGDYERFVTIDGEPYHHILDPRTGYPSASGLSSVAVIAEDGATADALSTAFMVMGEKKTTDFRQSGAYAFEALLIRTDGTLAGTAGMPALE